MSVGYLTKTTPTTCLYLSPKQVGVSYMNPYWPVTSFKLQLKNEEKIIMLFDTETHLNFVLGDVTSREDVGTSMDKWRRTYPAIKKTRVGRGVKMFDLIIYRKKKETEIIYSKAHFNLKYFMNHQIIISESYIL